MGKRIAAIIGIVVLIVMYLVSMLTAIFARPEAHQIFLATLVLTVVIPIVLWIYIRLYAISHEKKNGISIQGMRRLNKRLKAGEDPEKLAAEIDQEYQQNSNE